MIYVRQPTDEESQELQRMTRQEIGRVSQRAQMILLSAQKRTVPEITDIFDTTKGTVRFWMRRFEAEGPAGLYDEPRSGRPRQVVPEVEQKLIDLIEQDPQLSGRVTTFWTVAMLTLALVKQLQVQVSVSWVRLALHRLGLRWGRPRLSMPLKVDPDKARKQWQIAQAVVEAGPEGVVLYADESRVQLLPLIRALWHWAGQQVRVPTPGSNARRWVWGALNIRSGQWLYLVREPMRQDDFIAFLDQVLTAYPAVPIILIVDNYSSHLARSVRDWLVAHPRLRLFYLPTYGSHLNPVEPIWLRLKNGIAANRLYGSMTLLLEAVDSSFHDMTPELALTWAAE